MIDLDFIDAGSFVLIRKDVMHNFLGEQLKRIEDEIENVNKTKEVYDRMITHVDAQNELISSMKKIDNTQKCLIDVLELEVARLRGLLAMRRMF